MICPVKNYRITQGFGGSFTGTSRQAKHQGIDFVSPDLKVYSAHNGTVRSVGFQPKLAGNYITIWTEDKQLYTCYFHLASLPQLRVGQYVSEGQEIGIMGRTGNSTGVHLHFELRKPKLWGIRYDFLDPTPFLNSVPTPQPQPNPTHLEPFKVQVQRGDGLSMLAKKGGLPNPSSPTTWQAIYNLNQGYRGSWDWKSMNARLKVGDWIIVKL